MGAQVQAQNVVDNVLSGAAAHTHKRVNTRIQTHQSGQQDMSPQAQARMPVGNFHQQQQHPRMKPKSRGPSVGNHLAPSGVISTKPRTPSMLGMYAITVGTTPEKDMPNKVLIKTPHTVADNSTQVVDTTALASLPPLLCLPSRDDSVMNLKPKVETALANATGMAPGGGSKLPQTAQDIIQQEDTTASQSSPLQCSPTCDDSRMELKEAWAVFIQEASKKPQWIEMPMPHIVSDSSENSALVVDAPAPAPFPLLCSPPAASVMENLKPKIETHFETAKFIQETPKSPKRVETSMPQIVSRSSQNGVWVVDTTVSARSEAAKSSLLFYDDTKAGSTRLHCSDTREDAVSFAFTAPLHRGLNPMTSLSSLSRAAIGFSSDSLIDEDIIEAVKPLMPFLSSSDRSMETIKKAITAAVNAVAEEKHPLTYLYEFICFPTVAPPEKVTGAVAGSKSNLETPTKAPVKAPVKTPVEAFIKTPVRVLLLSSVAAENAYMPTNSPLSPLAPAFIPSPKCKGPAWSSKRVASSHVTTPLFSGGSYTNQPSSPLRLQEHIDSIICATGSPPDLQERILVRAANKLASLSPRGLKLRAPFSLPAQQIRFPGNTPFNTPVKGSKAEALAETPTKGLKLGRRSASTAGGSLRNPAMPQTPAKCPAVMIRHVGMTDGSLRDPDMPQKSPAPEPNDSLTPLKMAPGPFAKEDTRYYKTPTRGGLVATRVASFGGGNTGLTRASSGSPGQARASKEPQGVEMPHNGGVFKTIAAAVGNIQRATQKASGLQSFTPLIPSNKFNSVFPTASGKVVDDQTHTGSATAQKLPSRQKRLSSSKWAPPASAPKGTRSNAARRNRPLRGPHADALAMFEDLQWQQQAPDGTGQSQPPMVKSKSTFNLDVEMTDAPQADITATVPKNHSTGLEATWAASLPQAWEPDLRCDAIKTNHPEFPDLTDPKWCLQRVTITTTPPPQKSSPRVTFPTTPPAQRPPPLNYDLKDESHGFRRERAESFSQTSPVFQNETKYGPPRLKGLAVRLPKASHSSPRSSQPPGTLSPLSPHTRLNRGERNGSPRRNKLMEKLRPL